MSRQIRPVRTVVATLAGGIVGLLLLGAVAGYVIGPLLEVQGLAALAPPLIGGIVGAVVGAGSGLTIAFRDEPRRRRLITVLVVLVPAAALLTAAAVDLIDPMIVHPVALAVLLPALALLGRFLTTRRDMTAARPRSDDLA